MLESVWRDVQYAGRTLRKSYGFTAVAVLSLALGIGANTAIFSLINALILRPLPVREPHQLVELLSGLPGQPRMNGFGWGYYEHVRDHNDVFSGVIGLSPSRFQVGGTTFATEAMDGEYVVGDFFDVLGMRPAIGRLIGAQDDRLGSADSAVAVISWPFWQARFNLDPAVLGQQIVINGVPATIVGVTPREFFGLDLLFSPDFWVPVAMEPLIQRPSRRANGTLGVRLIGRLKPGVSIDEARAQMVVLDRWRVEESTKSGKAPQFRDLTIEVESARAGFATLRDHLGNPLLALMTMVGLLLLIACTNIASLLLVRATARQKEMALRVSLGAGRVRLLRQILAEPFLLSVTGVALGVVLAFFGVEAVGRFVTPLLPRPVDFRAEPDAQVLLFTAGVAMMTGLLFGLAPAWNAFTSSTAASLRDTGRSGETKSRKLFGKSLVVAQVALSVVLLSAAGLFVSHLSNLRNVGLGFERNSVLLVTLDPRPTGYDSSHLTRVYQELLGRFAAMPAVRSATLSAVTPIQGPGASRFVNVEGFREPPESRRYVTLNWIGPKYFETFGTPLIAGREFQFDDAGRGRVAIINHAMARYYFGDASPLGKHVELDGEKGPYEIVGMVGDAKYYNLYETPPRTLYLCAFQEGRIFSQFALRTAVPPETIAGDVRRLIQDELKSVHITKLTTLNDQLNGSIVLERFVAKIAGAFGALGATLAGIGLYGLLAYTVARRRREIGIRVALGATRRDVTSMVLKGALALAVAGLLVGTPIAIWTKRFAATLFPAVPTETVSLIPSAAVAMVAIALLSAYIPARRAARVDPAETLRRD